MWMPIAIFAYSLLPLVSVQVNAFSSLKSQLLDDDVSAVNQRPSHIQSSLTKRNMVETELYENHHEEKISKDASNSRHSLLLRSQLGDFKKSLFDDTAIARSKRADSEEDASEEEATKKPPPKETQKPKPKPKPNVGLFSEMLKEIPKLLQLIATHISGEMKEGDNSLGSLLSAIGNGLFGLFLMGGTLLVNSLFVTN